MDNIQTRCQFCGACMASPVLTAQSSASGASDGLKAHEVHPKSSDNCHLKCIKSVPENPVPAAPRFVIGNTVGF